ncbi:unnamed protein product [Staurois parvus]|uniref:Uncharacterized protein n=1 Tax=Staurois parvus TaxID=386267 RepID=A0ABN9BMR6_9NEOB|nr:unnamed protein product [Staurois parvus]
MHSPKKKKHLSSNTHQTDHVQTALYMSPYQEIRGGHWKGRIREVKIKHLFYTTQRINLLGSTVSITSMLYCIYRLILLLWV